MALVYKEIELEDFEGWGGAEDVFEKIVEAGKLKDFEVYLTELYPDGIDEIDLNDLLRYDGDMVLRDLRIKSYMED